MGEVARIDGVTVHVARGLGPLGGDGRLAIVVPLPAAGWSDGRGTLAVTVRDGGVVETVAAPLPLSGAAARPVRVGIFPEVRDMTWRICISSLNHYE